MTSDEQKASDPTASVLQRMKDKFRGSAEFQSFAEEMRKKIEAEIRRGTISELDDADFALRSLFDSLDLTEFFVAYEENGLEHALSPTSTVRELLWLLKKLEIDEKRQQRR